ncbi:MAG: Gfo/Idh/MocA family oxidoreductase [Candidatus Latescibacteria bacterium]|nr:Gfo/Idh/MocA family oxidoreductase [Candidatus Latescibacterota bacterium]
MAASYRVAVVGGAGTWGRHYLAAYDQNPECTITGLVDSSGERRAAFARRYGISHEYDSIQDLLQDQKPDIVSAVVPVESNPAIVIACAEAGVRLVSCEKPIAVSLQDADTMLATCRERGTIFSCGSVYADVPGLSDVLTVVQQGHLGRIESALIPRGLPVEMAGAGCVPLTLLRLLTQQEIIWVEGFTLPPAPGWDPPDGIPKSQVDCPGYGRVGLSGGGICDIPQPRLNPTKDSPMIGVTGSTGTITLGADGPVLDPIPAGYAVDYTLENPFSVRIKRLVRAIESGRDELGSDVGYHRALEAALAIRCSSELGHTRLELPLKNRSLSVYPHPYRLKGGDVAGWASFGYAGPPEVR